MTVIYRILGKGAALKFHDRLGTTTFWVMGEWYLCVFRVVCRFSLEYLFFRSCFAWHRVESDGDGLVQQFRIYTIPTSYRHYIHSMVMPGNGKSM